MSDSPGNSGSLGREMDPLWDGSGCPGKAVVNLAQPLLGVQEF